MYKLTFFFIIILYMTDFKSKYLKYKKKYIDYKNKLYIKGGGGRNNPNKCKAVDDIKSEVMVDPNNLIKYMRNDDIFPNWKKAKANVNEELKNACQPIYGIFPNFKEKNGDLPVFEKVPAPGGDVSIYDCKLISISFFRIISSLSYNYILDKIETLSKFKNLVNASKNTFKKADSKWNSELINAYERQEQFNADIYYMTITDIRNNKILNDQAKIMGAKYITHLTVDDIIALTKSNEEDVAKAAKKLLKDYNINDTAPPAAETPKQAEAKPRPYKTSYPLITDPNNRGFGLISNNDKKSSSDSSSDSCSYDLYHDTNIKINEIKSRTRFVSCGRFMDMMNYENVENRLIIIRYNQQFYLLPGILLKNERYLQKTAFYYDLKIRNLKCCYDATIYKDHTYTVFKDASILELINNLSISIMKYYYANEKILSHNNILKLSSDDCLRINYVKLLEKVYNDESQDPPPNPLKDDFFQVRHVSDFSINPPIIPKPAKETIPPQGGFPPSPSAPASAQRSSPGPARASANKAPAPAPTPAPAPAPEPTPDTSEKESNNDNFKDIKIMTSTSTKKGGEYIQSFKFTDVKEKLKDNDLIINYEQRPKNRYPNKLRNILLQKKSDLITYYTNTKINHFVTNDCNNEVKKTLNNSEKQTLDRQCKNSNKPLYWPPGETKFLVLKYNKDKSLPPLPNIKGDETNTLISGIKLSRNKLIGFNEDEDTDKKQALNDLNKQTLNDLLKEFLSENITLKKLKEHILDKFEELYKSDKPEPFDKNILNLYLDKEDTNVTLNESESTPEPGPTKPESETPPETPESEPKEELELTPEEELYKELFNEEKLELVSEIKGAAWPFLENHVVTPVNNLKPYLNTKGEIKVWNEPNMKFAPVFVMLILKDKYYILNGKRFRKLTQEKTNFESKNILVFRPLFDINNPTWMETNTTNLYSPSLQHQKNRSKNKNEYFRIERAIEDIIYSDSKDINEYSIDEMISLKDIFKDFLAMWNLQIDKIERFASKPKNPEEEASEPTKPDTPTPDTPTPDTPTPGLGPASEDDKEEEREGIGEGEGEGKKELELTPEEELYKDLFNEGELKLFSYKENKDAAWPYLENPVVTSANNLIQYLNKQGVIKVRVIPSDYYAKVFVMLNSNDKYYILNGEHFRKLVENNPDVKLKNILVFRPLYAKDKNEKTWMEINTTPLKSDSLKKEKEDNKYFKIERAIENIIYPDLTDIDLKDINEYSIDKLLSLGDIFEDFLAMWKLTIDKIQKFASEPHKIYDKPYDWNTVFNSKHFIDHLSEEGLVYVSRKNDDSREQLPVFVVYSTNNRSLDGIKYVYIDTGKNFKERYNENKYPTIQLPYVVLPVLGANQLNYYEYKKVDFTQMVTELKGINVVDEKHGIVTNDKFEKFFHAFNNFLDEEHKLKYSNNTLETIANTLRNGDKRIEEEYKLEAQDNLIHRVITKEISELKCRSGFSSTKVVQKQVLYGINIKINTIKNRKKIRETKELQIRYPILVYISNFEAFYKSLSNTFKCDFGIIYPVFKSESDYKLILMRIHDIKTFKLVFENLKDLVIHRGRVIIFKMEEEDIIKDIPEGTNTINNILKNSPSKYEVHIKNILTSGLKEGGIFYDIYDVNDTSLDKTTKEKNNDKIKKLIDIRDDTPEPGPGPGPGTPDSDPTEPESESEDKELEKILNEIKDYRTFYEDKETVEEYDLSELFYVYKVYYQYDYFVKFEFRSLVKLFDLSGSIRIPDETKQYTVAFTPFMIFKYSNDDYIIISGEIIKNIFDHDLDKFKKIYERNPQCILLKLPKNDEYSEESERVQLNNAHVFNILYKKIYKHATKTEEEREKTEDEEDEKEGREKKDNFNILVDNKKYLNLERLSIKYLKDKPTDNLLKTELDDTYKPEETLGEVYNRFKEYFFKNPGDIKLTESAEQEDEKKESELTPEDELYKKLVDEDELDELINKNVPEQVKEIPIWEHKKYVVTNFTYFYKHLHEDGRFKTTNKKLLPFIIINFDKTYYIISGANIKYINNKEDKYKDKVKEYPLYANIIKQINKESDLKNVFVFKKLNDNNIRPILKECNKNSIYLKHSSHQVIVTISRELMFDEELKNNSEDYSIQKMFSLQKDIFNEFLCIWGLQNKLKDIISEDDKEEKKGEEEREGEEGEDEAPKEELKLTLKEQLYKNLFNEDELKLVSEIKGAVWPYLENPVVTSANNLIQYLNNKGNIKVKINKDHSNKMNFAPVFAMLNYNDKYYILNGANFQQLVEDNPDFKLKNILVFKPLFATTTPTWMAINTTLLKNKFLNRRKKKPNFTIEGAIETKIYSEIDINKYSIDKLILLNSLEDHIFEDFLRIWNLTIDKIQQFASRPEPTSGPGPGTPESEPTPASEDDKEDEAKKKEKEEEEQRIKEKEAEEKEQKEKEQKEEKDFEEIKKEFEEQEKEVEENKTDYDLKNFTLSKVNYLNPDGTLPGIQHVIDILKRMRNKKTIPSPPPKIPEIKSIKNADDIINENYYRMSLEEEKLPDDNDNFIKLLQGNISG